MYLLTRRWCGTSKKPLTPFRYQTRAEPVWVSFEPLSTKGVSMSLESAALRCHATFWRSSKGGPLTTTIDELLRLRIDIIVNRPSSSPLVINPPFLIILLHTPPVFSAALYRLRVQGMPHILQYPRRADAHGGGGGHTRASWNKIIQFKGERGCLLPF
ncbi:hypothetical protein BJ912DRAFT_176430 [Pholiota molesta]|nr:hypothetical protein BJ912DRAFT_176430 [Pholiota molesta]